MCEHRYLYDICPNAFCHMLCPSNNSKTLDFEITLPGFNYLAPSFIWGNSLIPMSLGLLICKKG